MGKRKSWSEKEEKLLKKYYKEGMTDKEISKYLDRTPNAIKQHRRIKGWLKRDKMNFDKWSNNEEKQLIEMKNNGYKNKEIARELNRSLSSVTNKIIQMDLTEERKYQNWTKKERKKLHELVERGLTDKEIAKKLNRTFASVMNERNRLELKKNN